MSLEDLFKPKPKPPSPPQPPVEPKWLIVYKERGKFRSVVVSGVNTEELAIRTYIKGKLPYNTIQSVERIA